VRAGSCDVAGATVLMHLPMERKVVRDPLNNMIYLMKDKINHQQRMWRKVHATKEDYIV
jgi:hypothetical protein